MNENDAADVPMDQQCRGDERRRNIDKMMEIKCFGQSNSSLQISKMSRLVYLVRNVIGVLRKAVLFSFTDVPGSIIGTKFLSSKCLEDS